MARARDNHEIRHHIIEVAVACDDQVWACPTGAQRAHGHGDILIVPVSFETDFASVPRLLWPILPLSDAVYDKAAVLHDYAVRNRKLIGYSLMDCHRLFREVLQFSGTGRVKTAVMYSAVVMFNWMKPGAGRG